MKPAKQLRSLEEESTLPTFWLPSREWSHAPREKKDHLQKRAKQDRYPGRITYPTKREGRKIIDSTQKCLKKKTIAMAMSVEGRLPHPNFPLSKRSGGPLMNLRLKVPWKLSKVKPVDPTFMRDVWYRTYNIDIKCWPVVVIKFQIYLDCQQSLYIYIFLSSPSYETTKA